MVKITFLGSCREVGRSAILIESKTGTKCMFDYGIRFRGDERLPYPDADIKNLKAVALTHCHVDHSGAIPYLYKNSTIPLFTNALSLRIIKVLIEDMIRISNYPYPFGYRELKALMTNARFLENGFKQKIADDYFITFLNAGHVPGSVSILIEVDDKKILYTGDINSGKTNLVEPADPNGVPPLDALITESTYALRDHPPREEVEQNFIDNVINVTENGGKVLVPAFGVARSQEVMMILDKYNYEGPVFASGLAKEISDIYLESPTFFNNFSSLKKAHNKVQFINSKGRREVNKSKGVLIAPSGMLKGGTAINFIKSYLNDPVSAIYLVGYQVERSPGRKLLDSGVFEYKEELKNKKTIRRFRIKAECDTDYFDFSGHGDKSHLNEYIENLKFINGERDVFCVHGDPKSTTSLSSDLVKKGFNSVAPETGEVYKI